MKLRFCTILLGFLTLLHSAHAIPRVVSSFDAGWLFFKGDGAGAHAFNYNDSEWRHVDVPHDWSIEAPFSADNPTGPGGGFLPSGVGWYRKHFTVPDGYAGRRIFIEFDGVMANSDVWINGAHLGKRPYGYVSFGYELTEKIRIGKGETNVLAVRADNSLQPASRWYTGAGIYRHVRLVCTDPVHFVKWGTFITAHDVTKERALVRLRGAVENQSQKRKEIAVDIKVLSPAGKTIADASAWLGEIPSGATVGFTKELAVSNPALWQLHRPDIYRARLALRSAGAVLDDETLSFGIRDARFLPETGFWLNGTNVKIKGVCLHHDGGAFGAAVPLRVWERRLEQLRRLGVNAIRTAHNPPAPEFLDLCDRMGFLVMDELFDCWTVAKTPYDYHRHFIDWAHADVRDTVLRDRNHPSVILYSAGNEIRDTVHEAPAKRVLAALVSVFHKYDPSRPVTQGLFRPNVSRDYDNGLADLLDVVGTNYRDLELLAAWEAKPTRRIIGTEQRHELATWLAARDHPQHSGQFLWSGIDYLGESFGWPVIGAGFGLLDRTGEVKPMAYERMSWWSDKPVVHAVRRISPAKTVPQDPGFVPIMGSQTQFADWTPADRRPHEETVEAYSNCEEVELLLNGKSLGKKRRNADDSPRSWKVHWEPGLLEAVGRNGGAVAAKHELRTAGEPARILLTADRTRISFTWDDVAFVTAAVTDRNGIPVPDAADLVSFKIKGPGIIAAVDNGDNTSHEPFRASERRAYQGRCCAIVRAAAGRGKITVGASASGLAGDSIVLEAVPGGKDP